MKFLRAWKAKKRFKNSLDVFREKESQWLDQSITYYARSEEQESESISAEEALSRPDSQDWRKDIKNEMDSLVKNETYEITILLLSKKALKTKWVFKEKDVYENNKFKARLVIKGYSQKESVDYCETFSRKLRITEISFFVSGQRKSHGKPHGCDNGLSTR